MMALRVIRRDMKHGSQLGVKCQASMFAGGMSVRCGREVVRDIV